MCGALDIVPYLNHDESIMMSYAYFTNKEDEDTKKFAWDYTVTEGSQI